MRILGLDPGEKRIGIAVTDPLGITAQGIDVITFQDLDDALAEIQKICQNYQVERIVVGNPLNMNGTRGPGSANASHLAQLIEEKLGLPVELIDERLTSVSADKILITGGVRRKNRRKVKDKLAAVMILENYLASL